MHFVAPRGFKVANHVLEQPAASSSTMNLATAGSNETLVTTYKTGIQHCEFSLLHYLTYTAKPCAPTKRKTPARIKLPKVLRFSISPVAFKWRPTYDGQFQKVNVTHCENMAQKQHLGYRHQLDITHSWHLLLK